MQLQYNAWKLLRQQAQKGDVIIKNLVIFITEKGIGSKAIDFKHEYPTFEEIRKAEDDIQKEYNSQVGALIINWKRLEENEFEDTARIPDDNKNMEILINDVRNLADAICADYQEDPRIVELHKRLKGL